jgi:hypothetical protein
MSDNTKQKKIRTLSPEQLEKMKLARTAKALERRETKAKEKELQSQAIDQQKERIELLKLTKRKKAEIKRRLAEVKRGNADIKEVEEIIDQYDTNESSPLKEEMEAQEVESEPEPLPEVPEPEPEVVPKKTEKEQEQEIESIKLKIQEIKKEQEPIIIADPIEEYEKHFKETAKAIMNDLPKESKELFEEQLHHFNPKLDIEENIKNMILKINSRVSEKVKLVEKVLKTVEKCEAEELTANTNEMTDIKKGFVKQKLSQLYSLR